MKRRKMGVVMAVLMLALALAGCSAGNEGGKEDKGQKQEEKKQEEEKDPYVKGTVEGNHYENEWLNMRIDLPEDFVMATEEEQTNAQEAGGQFLDEEGKDTMDKAYDSGIASYEMMAATLNGIPNANIALEKLPYKNATVEQYIEVAREAVEKSTTGGMTISFADDVADTDVGGQTYKRMAGTAQIEVEGGSAEFNMDLYVRVQDGYAVVITTTYTADTAAQNDAFLASVQEF